MTSITDFLFFAEQLADSSEAIAQKYYRSPCPAELKDDNSPVTLADREIETALRERISAEYPSHGIIGEEEQPINADADYVWVLDPIDGTRAFMAGRPLFTTLISLTHQGEPIAGLINQPITGERWIGGKGTVSSTLNGRGITTRNCTDISDALLATTSPEYFSDTHFMGFGITRSAVRDVIYGGDAYNYALLATGHIDIVLEDGLKPFDMMALVPVIQGAGGIITDWEGQPLTLTSNPSGRVLACGSHAVHTQMLALLKAAIE